MRDTRSEPILTDSYESVDAFSPEGQYLYFYGRSSEPRSSHIDRWRESTADVTIYEIVDESQTDFRISGNDRRYFLRRSSDLEEFWRGVAACTKVYIDITGLTHPVWAALLKSALETRLEVLVVYVEPDHYKRSSAPVEGQIYDLSTRINGIAPLPGFAVLSQKSTSNFYFVPMLGFEGTRVKYILEQIEPGYERIIPIVGSPGFKPWYVFESYYGNKAALIETSAWQVVRYAPANCPFSCFYLLEEIAQSYPKYGLKIAPVGTKPHALGAVLFALTSSAETELVYDHPIRKEGRTDGASRLFVYHVSAIASGLTRRVRR